VDRRLRGSERSGDEAGALRARLQAGEVAEATLRLAAHCGQAAAAEALGLPVVQPPRLAKPQAHHLQVEALGTWAKVACEGQEPGLWLRGVLGAVSARSLPKRPSEARAYQALDVARDWLECPCGTHAAAADEARFTRSFAHCDDAKIVLEAVAMIALEIACGRGSPERAAAAIRALTHPIGGDPPARVRDALLGVFEEVWRGQL